MFVISWRTESILAFHYEPQSCERGEALQVRFSTDIEVFEEC